MPRAEIGIAVEEQLAITQAAPGKSDLMMITTHVLDIARGCPAGRIPVELDLFITGQGWREVGHGLTNDEGSIADFGEPPPPESIG